MASLTAKEWRMASKAWSAMQRGHALHEAWQRCDQGRNGGLTVAGLDALIWRWRGAVTQSAPVD